MVKIPTTRRKMKSEIKRSLLEKDERKARHNGPQEGGGGARLCLHSQEDQDLCTCVDTEELIFNTSSEHQTVDLSNKCMTKDFLRDFRHGCTVHGGQEDHSCQWIREGTDLWWYMWGCVRNEEAQRKHKGTSFARTFRNLVLMTTQKHWYLGWGTWLSCKNDAFARMVHGIHEVLLHTHQTPEQTPSQSVFSTFWRFPHNCIFEDSAGHNGPVRVRNTNLSVLTSETMWSQPILIDFTKQTCTFPPVTPRHSHWEHVWTVREFTLILLHKIGTKFDNMVKKRWLWKVFWKSKWIPISLTHWFLLPPPMNEWMSFNSHL